MQKVDIHDVEAEWDKLLRLVEGEKEIIHICRNGQSIIEFGPPKISGETEQLSEGDCRYIQERR